MSAYASQLASGVRRNRPVIRRQSGGVPLALTLAFTLVELLVVIGIIALLISILLPALSKARQQSQITQCLAVERQIGTAAINFAQTHDGYYPVAGNFALGASAIGTNITPAYVHDANRRRYCYEYVAGNGQNGLTLAPWQGALATYMGKKTAVDGGTIADQTAEEIGIRSYLKYFLCPTQIDKAGDLPESLIHSDGNSGWLVQQSYAVNECVFGINDAYGYLRGESTKIRQPSITVMLGDSLPGGGRGQRFVGSFGWITFYLAKAPTPSGLPITLEDAFAPTKFVTMSGTSTSRAGDSQQFDLLRHRGKIDVLFCDGHAETLVISAKDLRNAALMPK